MNELSLRFLNPLDREFWVFLANGSRLPFPSDAAIASSARYFR
ncbi:hypothetical protein [Nostoc sp.]